jgi:serine/threonine-protein kinase
MDDDVFDNVAGHALDVVEEQMRRRELVIALCTSNSILSIQLLGNASSRARAKRHALLDFARGLYAAFVDDAAVHVNVTLHVDRVNVSRQHNGDVEITSGILARTDSWAPAENVNGVGATPEFVGGLDGLVLLPGPEGLFVVTR